MKTEYRIIEEYPEYSISKNGEIQRNGKTRKVSLIHGYNKIVLSIDGKKKNEYVHRLVYETWKGKIVEGYTIDHINGNKLDNRISNLQHMSRYDNSKKFWDIVITKPVKGFKQIPYWNNYYITREGIILSFKFNKTEGIIINPHDNNCVILSKQNKTYRFSKQTLIDLTYLK